MRYKSVVALRPGGPEVLQIVENELREPSAGEARIKTLAASVSAPDITARRGKALYSGTPLECKFPLTPGYSIVGVVDAVGEGVTEVKIGKRVAALTVIGGYSEVLYWRSDRLIPVPTCLDPAEAVVLLLNYVVAYQALHRAAKVRPAERVLLIGASGGIGTALLQLGKLAGLKMYGVASGSKQAVLREYGATPIDYRTQDFVEVMRQLEPQGLDAVLDGIMSLDSVRGGLALLQRGGRLVSFGEPRGLPVLARILGEFLRVNLLPNGKSFKLYGTSAYFLGNRAPFLQDWDILFNLLKDGKIKPIIEKRFSLLEAAQANALLESGQVTGHVVLEAAEE